MGVDGHMLLRMLEPAVRPGGIEGLSRQPTKPLEQQSFEELLAQRMTPMPEDGQATDEEAGAQSPDAAKANGPLGQLAQLGQIENASLRDLIVRQARPGDGVVDL